MEKKISYLNKTYSDCKKALIEMSEKYYPDMAINYDDASVGAWMIDLNAYVADGLFHHIDRVYQETNIDSAQEKGSLYSLARNNGFKIPGPKGAMAEVKFSCVLPNNATNDGPDWNYAPIIRRGTKLSSASQQFELLEDIDFGSQFNYDSASDRTYAERRNSNGYITGYTVSKLAVVTAGETKIFSKTVYAADIKPFMEIVIPAENVMNVESIVVFDNPNVSTVPSYGMFYSEEESRGNCQPGSGFTRYYEVDNLAETKRWGSATDNNGNARKYLYGYNVDAQSAPIACYCVTKGEWKPVEHKFMTEYTDTGYLKIIFGSGTGENVDGSAIANAADFSKYQITRMLNNGNLGVLPSPRSTIFVLYRVGGGASSNVAKGAINRISALNANFRGTSVSAMTAVKTSITVENTIQSVSGKGMPSTEELKYLIKYHNAAQNRCVTLKDYVDRVLLLPPKYGTPFRVGAMEENNKVMLYLLGLDYKGQLDTALPMTLVNNIENYLSEYRMINDYVEIKSGRIVNVAFYADILIDSNYNQEDISSSVINTIKDYMDINKHFMGEEIYVGDLEKEISKIDGILNLTELRVYNKYGSGYSSTRIAQETIPANTMDEKFSDKVGDNYIDYIDLDASNGVLYNEGDTMLEIKYPAMDIGLIMTTK